jgi:YD repeat-containing protein
MRLLILNSIKAITLLLCFTGTSQELTKVIPPTPEISAFNKFGAAPPSLYNGVANISIPLYTIVTEHGFQLPLSIAYHASGIKVEEVSSPVGLGWTLSPINSVSQMVKGGDDFGGQRGYASAKDYNDNHPEDPYSIFPNLSNFTPNNFGGSYVGTSNDAFNASFYYASKVISGKPVNTFIKDYVTGLSTFNEVIASFNAPQMQSTQPTEFRYLTDSQPDEFRYSLPTGTSGSFYYDQNTQIHLVPRKDLIIEKYNDGYSIVDELGNKYSFRELTQVCDSKLTGTSNPNACSNTYKISSIITAQGDKIEYFYRGNNYSTFTRQLYDYTRENNCITTNSPPDNSIGDGYGKDYNSDSILDSITFNKGASIKFLYDDTPDLNVAGLTWRKDLPESRILRKIIVNNGQKNIHEFKLSQSYFETSEVINTSGGADLSQGRYRLRLDSIQELLSKATHTFGYNNNQSLPHRFSNSIDEWGYYNGKANYSTPLPACTLYGNYVSGADRSVSEEYAKANMLTEIHYPTKGYSKFEYESNEYNGLKAGGVRVKKITNISNGQQEIKKFEYKIHNTIYGSGHLLGIPVLISDYIDPGYSYDIKGQVNDVSCSFKKRSHNSIFPLGVVDGTSVAYPEVTELIGENGEGGRILYEFTHQADLIQGQYEYPNTPVTSYDWKRGLLKSKTTYKYASSGDPYANALKTSELINAYDYDYSANLNAYPPYNVNAENILKGLVFHVDYWDSQLIFCPSTKCNFYIIPHFSYTSYDITTGWVKPIRTTSRQYNTGSVGNYIETITNNTFGNSKHMQVTQSTTTSSNSKPIITKTFYPDDIKLVTDLRNDDLTGVEKTAIDSLKIEHRTAEPIQLETYSDLNGNGIADSGEILNTQRTNYKDWGPKTLGSGNIISPKEIQALKGEYNATTNVLEDRVIYHVYDDQGNPLEVSKADGVHIYYVWGYNKQHPIAKLENFTTSQASAIQTIINAAVTASNNDNSTASEDELRTALNNIRNNASTAMVTTFTYDPLIGVTSIADPKGNTMYYYYDAANRLKYIKDSNGKVLSKNEYHYKEQ